MTTLPIPNALRLAGLKLGLHVVSTHIGEAITTVSVYRSAGDTHAILSWERGHGIVTRKGLTWSPCSLAEATDVMAGAVSDDAGAEQESVAESSDPLDDPRMDGQTWIAAGEVTQVMLEAWPAWEWYRADHNLRGVELASTLTADGEPRPWAWRPLRLPGMNAKGEIPASAMTEEHFARVKEWQMSCSLCPWTRDGAPGMADVDDEDVSEFWRPAIFATLDEDES